MSAGVVHTRASLILAGGFFIGSFIWGGGGQEITGALLGILLSPDLDVDNGFDADRHIRNRVGKWAEVCWDGVWFFYRKSVKHGSELSHFPIISTIGRLAYLFLFTIVIPTLVLSLLFPARMDLGYELGWWWDRIMQHWRLIVGLMGSDLIHWALDILTTEHKTQN